MQVQIQTAHAKLTITLQAQADWTACLMTALIAALPCFLDAFTKCLAGNGGGSAGFTPGDRQRCD